MNQDVTAKMLKPDFDSEVSGLVHGYLFHEQRPPQPIASGEVCARYQALADDKAFIWLHLNLNHATAEKWLTSHFPVADFFFEEIRSGSHTTRIERQGENLFAVLNDVLFRPQDTSAETATLWLYCSPRLVVTVVVKFFWTRRSDGRVMHRRATGRQGWPAFRTVRVIGSQVLNAIGYCYKS
ncbi:hypothetical protein SN01_02752 [Klebsiella pneumoniae]|nr:hypothetical protein SN01_02752 [Klebsiella pneumoniae]